MYARFILLLLALLVVDFPVEAKDNVAHHRTAPEQLIPVVPPIVATYDLYVGGMHFITADIHFQEQVGKYVARVVVHTQGFWYKLFPWDAELLTNGIIRKDSFVPTEYSTHDIWGKKVKTAKLHFKRNGDVTSEFDPPQNDADHQQITFEQRRGSLDPITALLQLLAHVMVSKNCDVTVPVFDGKIRFDITGIDVGYEDVDDEEYGAFKGTARTCDASFNLVAGEWKEKVKSRFWYKSDTERGREPFHIWLAQPRPDLPELPIKLESGSVWGLVMIHLSNWKPETNG